MPQPSGGKGRRYISYSVSSANRRRNYRQAADGPEVPRCRSARKDTRQWCRGVIGRPHQYAWGEVRYVARSLRSRTYACQVCGKQRGYQSWFVDPAAED